MLKKKRFFVSAVSLMLTMAFAVVGVYSAINAKNWNVNGRIILNVNEISGKMVVYEGYVSGSQNNLEYYDKEVLDKDFTEVNSPWVLNEEHTTLTLARDNYFYQVVVQNTNQTDIYVSFEVPEAIVKTLTTEQDNVVNGTWLSQALNLVVYNNYDKAVVTSKTPFVSPTTENIDKYFEHFASPISQFPATKATTYNEEDLNNIGTENGYTTFSLKLEAGQVLSLYSFYKADFEKYVAGDATEFAVSNNFGVNYFKPTLQ